MGRLLLVNVFFIVFFNILSDFYVYRYLIKKITTNRIIKYLHWIVDFIFASILMYMFAGVYSERFNIPPEAYQDFMFIYLLIYIPKAIYMVFTLPAFLSRNSTYKKLVYIFGLLLALFLFVSCIYGATVGKNKLRVNEVTIYSDKLPPLFDGYRIVHFSDTHLGNLKNDKILRKMLNIIEVINPDIILFTGDLVHSRTSEVYKFQKILSEFYSPDGVFSVMGNHDYGDYYRWPDTEDYRKNRIDFEEFHKEINWVLLNNESRIIKKGIDSITIIGVENWGEPPFPQYGDLKKAMQEVVDGYKILLTHNPNHWIAEVYEKTDIDLTLSGHTHAMQLAFNIFGKRISPASLRYKLWGGLYSFGEQHIYVNEGIGFVLFPFRLGAPPELTVITLAKNE